MVQGRSTLFADVVGSIEHRVRVSALSQPRCFEEAVERRDTDDVAHKACHVSVVQLDAEERSKCAPVHEDPTIVDQDRGIDILNVVARRRLRLRDNGSLWVVVNIRTFNSVGSGDTDAKGV